MIYISYLVIQFSELNFTSGLQTRKQKANFNLENAEKNIIKNAISSWFGFKTLLLTSLLYLVKILREPQI